MSAARRFLVLHGWQNHRPPGHWQFWLVDRLRRIGEHVRYPQLAEPDDPSLDVWLETLRGELRLLGDGERVVICHSLGCLLWLQHAQTAGAADAVDRLLLVCPPGPSALPERLAPFYRPPVDRAAVARSVRRPAELVCTDADPWCPEGADAYYGDELELETHLVEGAGHLSLDEGFGPWPAVERWALDGTFPAPAAIRRRTDHTRAGRTIPGRVRIPEA